MVKPNFDFSNVDNSFKLRVQTDKMLFEAEGILKLIYLFYSMLGLLIAPIFNTWHLALIIGGINLTLFFLSQRSGQAEISRTYYSLGLAFFCIQFVIQSQGNIFFHIFLFNTLFLLVMLQNKRYFSSYLLVISIFYFILGVWLYTNNVLKNTLIAFAPDDFVNIFLLPLCIIQVGIFGYITTKYVRKNIQSSLKQAAYIEEKLNVNANTELALQIAHGELETDYQLKPDDILGEALIKMRTSLKELREGDRVQKWSSTGIASISELLLSETNLDRLVSKTLRELIKRLNAHQGAIYITQKKEDRTVLKLMSSYAGNKKLKLDELYLNEGEGIVGEAFRRKDLLEITEVPESYTFIKSGLGEAIPKSILIIPLNVKDKTVGVIEIASFNSFTKIEKHFLTNVSENIAVAIRSVTSTQETQKLLEEAQRFNEQITAQENLVQQTKEEIKAVQEQAKYYQSQSDQYALILNTITQIDSVIFYHKEIESGDLIFLSDSFEQITGFSTEDFLVKKSKKLTDIIQQEETEVSQSKVENSSTVWYQMIDVNGKLLKVEDTFIEINNKESIGFIRVAGIL